MRFSRLWLYAASVAVLRYCVVAEVVEDNLQDLSAGEDDRSELDLGEAWVDTLAAPNIPVTNFTQGSIKLVASTWLDVSQNASSTNLNGSLGEGEGQQPNTTANTTETVANNAALATAYYYSGPGCLGTAMWTMEVKTDCRSEPLLQSGDLRLKLCPTATAEIISGDGAVIESLREGCHSSGIDGAVKKYNNYCRSSKQCQGCSTIPAHLCTTTVACKTDTEFDAIYYADKYSGNHSEVAEIANDTDKLLHHWINQGQKNAWVGCNGCCDGKALTPSCAYTSVGCSRSAATAAAVREGASELGAAAVRLEGV